MQLQLRHLLLLTLLHELWSVKSDHAILTTYDEGDDGDLKCTPSTRICDMILAQYDLKFYQMVEYGLERLMVSAVHSWDRFGVHGV